MQTTGVTKKRKGSTIVSANDNVNTKKGRKWKTYSTVDASTGQVQNTGLRTEDEHALFLEGLQRHGSSIESWTKIATTLVKTRTAKQIRGYAERHFRKQAKTVCHDGMSRLTDKVGVGDMMDEEDGDVHDLQEEFFHDKRRTEVPEGEEQLGASSSSISTLAVVTGVDTDMQQRIALARANSGYIALTDKQSYRRTTNNSKRAAGRISQSCDVSMQTSSTTPLLGEHTKRRDKNLAKVVFDVEKAPSRPSSIASKVELDEASSVQKGDNDSDEDSCDSTCDEDL